VKFWFFVGASIGKYSFGRYPNQAFIEKRIERLQKQIEKERVDWHIYAAELRGQIAELKAGKAELKNEKGKS
jgi:hypothetical protein